jgi:hypothetical protein
MLTLTKPTPQMGDKPFSPEMCATTVVTKPCSCKQKTLHIFLWKYMPPSGCSGTHWPEATQHMQPNHMRGVTRTTSGCPGPGAPDPTSAEGFSSSDSVHHGENEVVSSHPCSL